MIPVGASIILVLLNPYLTFDGPTPSLQMLKMIEVPESKLGIALGFTAVVDPPHGV
jgi:hypothetical protein